MKILADKSCDVCKFTTDVYIIQTSFKNNKPCKETWIVYVCPLCNNISRTVNNILCSECSGVVSDLDNVCTSCGIIQENEE